MMIENCLSSLYFKEYLPAVRSDSFNEMLLLSGNHGQVLLFVTSSPVTYSAQTDSLAWSWSLFYNQKSGRCNHQEFLNPAEVLSSCRKPKPCPHEQMLTDLNAFCLPCTRRCAVPDLPELPSSTAPAQADGSELLLIHILPFGRVWAAWFAKTFK